MYKCVLCYYDVLARMEFTPMHYSQPRLEFIFLLRLIPPIDTMHPLLEDVLKEPRLAATSPHIAIVLLPPIDTMPPAPCTLDFLGKAKAVIPNPHFSFPPTIAPLTHTDAIVSYSKPCHCHIVGSHSRKQCISNRHAKTIAFSFHALSSLA